MSEETRFTPEVVKVVIEGIGARLPYRRIAERAGIDRATLWRWRVGLTPRHLPDDQKHLIHDLERAIAQREFEEDNERAEARERLEAELAAKYGLF